MLLRNEPTMNLLTSIYFLQNPEKANNSGEQEEVNFSNIYRT